MKTRMLRLLKESKLRGIHLLFKWQRLLKLNSLCQWQLSTVIDCALL
jgi:hypothetical protein